MTPIAAALPENTGDGYVAAAYIVFFAIVLIYVTIMAIRLTRVERGLRELNERAERPRQQETPGEVQSRRQEGKTDETQIELRERAGQPQERPRPVGQPPRPEGPHEQPRERETV